MTEARYLKWITKFMIDIYLGRNNFLTLRDCFHSILIHFAISGRYFIKILQQTNKFLFFPSSTRVVMKSDADCVLVFVKRTTDGGFKEVVKYRRREKTVLVNTNWRMEPCSSVTSEDKDVALRMLMLGSITHIIFVNFCPQCHLSRAFCSLWWRGRFLFVFVRLRTSVCVYCEYFLYI